MPPSGPLLHADYITYPAILDGDGVIQQLIERALQSGTTDTVIGNSHSAMGGNATDGTIDTPPPSTLASNALMAVLLSMIVILAFYFCWISNREVNDVQARQRNAPNAINTMTPYERARYVKHNLITKKYEEQKTHVSEVENRITNVDAIDNGEVVAIDNGDDYSHDQCPICLLDYEEGDLISWSRNKKCHHYFHRDCLLVWLMKHEDCPYCRRPYLVDITTDVSTRTVTDVEAGTAPSMPRPGSDDALPTTSEVSS